MKRNVEVPCPQCEAIIPVAYSFFPQTRDEPADEDFDFYHDCPAGDWSDRSESAFLEDVREAVSEQGDDGGPDTTAERDGDR